MVKEFIYAFCSTIGFGILFNIPRKELIFSAISGALGWVIYKDLMNNFESGIMASFFGALAVGISSEIFARVRKMPATVFVIPGIIPLVPGYGLYYAMLKIIEKNYDEASAVGFETVLVAITIASGIIISTSIGKMIKNSLGDSKNDKKIEFGK